MLLLRQVGSFSSVSRRQALGSSPNGSCRNPEAFGYLDAILYSQLYNKVITKKNFQCRIIFLLVRCDTVQDRITYKSFNEIMKTIFPILVALAVLSPVGAAAQTMHKCVQDGKITFQSELCPATAKQDTLKSYGKAPALAPTVASGGAGSGASAPGFLVPSGEDNRVIEFMSTYRACADGVQIFRQEMAGRYDDWRLRNLEVVLRVKSDPQLRALYEQRVEAKRNGKAGMCRSVGLELRGKQ